MIVVGGGILGLSVSVELQKKISERISLFDSRKVGQGTTALSAGMIRVFHRDSSLIDLALKSLRLFERHKRFRQYGSLSILPQALHEYAKFQKNNLCRLGYPCELMTSEAVKERFSLSVGQGMLGFYEEKAGSLDPSLFLNELKGTFVKNGGQIFEKVGVYDILFDGGRVRGVSTSMGDFEGEKVLLSAGAQSQVFLRKTGVEKGKQKKILAHKVKTHLHERSFPNLFDYSNRFYCGRLHHSQFILGHADNPSWASTKLVAEELTGLEFEHLQEISGVDLYFSNQSGLSNSICGWPGLYVHTGWGGGAFKFSAALAELAAKKISLHQEKKTLSLRGAFRHEN